MSQWKIKWQYFSEVTVEWDFNYIVLLQWYRGHLFRNLNYLEGGHITTSNLQSEKRSMNQRKLDVKKFAHKLMLPEENHSRLLEIFQR